MTVLSLIAVTMITWLISIYAALKMIEAAKEEKEFS